MEHTTRIELENLKDLHAVELGVLESKNVRRLTIEDALVDTGATGLCLPKSLIEQLGLTPLRNIRVQTANGPAERTFYSEVKYTVLIFIRNAQNLLNINAKRVQSHENAFVLKI